MIAVYMKMAMRSIGGAKWRSFLTMLGVLIGVLSVVTIVSLGEGVRQQLEKQINQSGSSLITVRPGQLVSRDQNGDITEVKLLGVIGNGSLSEADIATIKKTKNIGTVVPFGLMTGVATYDKNKLDDVFILGTSKDLPAVLGKEVQYGNFFSEHDAKSAVAVIGERVAEDLFEEHAPIGKTFKLRGKEVIVRGVMEHSEPNPLNPGHDYNAAIFLPYEYAKQLAGGQLQNYQTLVLPAKGSTVTQVVKNLNDSLKKSHGGQQDFTVLQASDNLAIANNALSLITALVAGIAAISLLVGGIGIMNIMLVAVSERTHEIGVRKSIGATNQQILAQFFIEAVMLSGVGGILGVIASLLANYFIRLTTSLQPAISPLVMGGAFLVALLVGSFFGLMPAIKAAHKDPIESLRRI